ncbi:uncharacterized protein [Miscanthus floridulus]|uniref:uncharacterized protein n=1 Tax=Miscanthus floridulus TaxID=154761 RepID=UPI00345934BA
MALGASASGPVSPGGGGEGAPGLAIARPRAEANTPETRASAKRAVSPMGSMAEVERAMAGVIQLPPQGVEGALESGEGRPVPAGTEVVPLLLPLPPPLPRTRDAVKKLLLPHLSRKRQAKATALVPLKALKVSASATARWVVDAQAALQRGAASARATEAATKQSRDEVTMPREAVALEASEAEAPTIAEATEGEARAPRTSEAEVVETGVSRTSEAEVVETRVSRTTKAEAAEAGASRTTEAKVAEASSGAAEASA